MRYDRFVDSHNKEQDILSHLFVFIIFFILILIRNLASCSITTHRSNFLMTATCHRFNFLQPTTTHRIFLNRCPRVPHMFKWNSPNCIYNKLFNSKTKSAATPDTLWVFYRTPIDLRATFWLLRVFESISVMIYR